MQVKKGSFHNLLALGESGPTVNPLTTSAGTAENVDSAGLPSIAESLRNTSRFSLDSSESVARPTRLIIVANQLPLRSRHGSDGWEFEWDEDALIAQAKEGLCTEETPNEVIYVGCLPVEIALEDQDKIALGLRRQFNCCPVFMDLELRQKFYKDFCKQQLWPLFHYILPMSFSSPGRFNLELWQAYVKANKVFADRVVEELATECDYVWIHDYHLLVLPSLLRKRFNRIRCGLFLHSPFPSSEIFRTFPKREELLRSLLNADIIGFHTFDYARHFLSCCSRMLGLEHETSRGVISIEYYGRNVALKIMPTGVNPDRYLAGFGWDEFKWRRGELLAQFEDQVVLVGVDDMDLFKGIELKLQAIERVLELHIGLRGKLVLVQIANPARSSGRDITELRDTVHQLVESINKKYGDGTYQPIHLIERHVPLHERMAFYSIADCAVVTATRDGMNLVAYEYITCRQGPSMSAVRSISEITLGTTGGGALGSTSGALGSTSGALGSTSGVTTSGPLSNTTSGVLSVDDVLSNGGGVPVASCKSSEGVIEKPSSMLVVSEFVGCSPSLSGAIRVNPWSVDSVAYGIYSAISLPLEQRQQRHEKHWRYVSHHTVAYWAQSFVSDLHRMTKNHPAMKCYGLGLGLDTFRMVALDANFRKLEEGQVILKYQNAAARVLFLDYDGTLTVQNSISLQPSEDVLAVLRALTADAGRNHVCLFSGRPKADLEEWFASVPSLGLVAENGFFFRAGGQSEWETLVPLTGQDMSWKRTTLPILQQYQDRTDGSFIEIKESSLVWGYKDADPDFGSWQAKELLDHLESVLSNEAVDIVGSNSMVEVRPQGVSKGKVVEHMLAADGARGRHPDFILCVGDDRSDEDMFTCIIGSHCHVESRKTTEVFACTVGQKPSHAPFYLNEPAEVMHLLEKLSNAETVATIAAMEAASL